VKSDLQRGVVIGLSIYGIGTILTVIVHQIFGWLNPHSPPTSALPLFLTLIIGAWRLLVTAFNGILKKSKTAKGELMVHIGAGIIVFGFVVWLNQMG
jgi:hypothetical protein